MVAGRLGVDSHGAAQTIAVEWGIGRRTAR